MSRIRTNISFFSTYLENIYYGDTCHPNEKRCYDVENILNGYISYNFQSERFEKKRVEKNLRVKQFIKQIDYAKDQIAVNLHYVKNFKCEIVPRDVFTPPFLKPKK
jgi:hypothetical protein